MPTASGIECVRVLVGLGWLPEIWSQSECHLQRGDVALVVPLDPELSSTQVGAIADRAGISPLVFVEVLEKIRTGRITTTAGDPEEERKSG